MNEVIAEFIVITVVIFICVFCLVDLNINLSTMRKVKNLEERVAELEQEDNSDA